MSIRVQICAMCPSNLYLYLYITKSLSVVFNVSMLKLSHISSYIITIFFPEFILQFKNSFSKFKNPNKKKMIPNLASFTITILEILNPISFTVTISNSNPLRSTVTISNNNSLCSMVTISIGNPSTS